MSIAYTSDGVALNGRSSCILCLCYGLDAPCYHCAAHSSDLVMKRIAKSKTMSVPKVVKTYDCLQRVIKHFKMSFKSKGKFNEALAILKMNQLKLLSWGGTRMAHFVAACKQLTKLLPVVCNRMYITDIKKEEGNVHCGNTRGKLFFNSNEYDMQFNQQSHSHENVTSEEKLQNIKKKKEKKNEENMKRCLTKCRREYEELFY